MCNRLLIFVVHPLIKEKPYLEDLHYCEKDSDCIPNYCGGTSTNKYLLYATYGCGGPLIDQVEGLTEEQKTFAMNCPHKDYGQEFKYEIISTGCLKNRCEVKEAKVSCYK